MAKQIEQTRDGNPDQKSDPELCAGSIGDFGEAPSNVERDISDGRVIVCVAIAATKFLGSTTTERKVNNRGSWVVWDSVWTLGGAAK